MKKYLIYTTTAILIVISAFLFSNRAVLKEPIFVGEIVYWWDRGAGFDFNGDFIVEGSKDDHKTKDKRSYKKGNIAFMREEKFVYAHYNQNVDGNRFYLGDKDSPTSVYFCVDANSRRNNGNPSSSKIFWIDTDDVMEFIIIKSMNNFDIIGLDKNGIFTNFSERYDLKNKFYDNRIFQMRSHGVRIIYEDFKVDNDSISINYVAKYNNNTCKGVIIAKWDKGKKDFSFESKDL